MKFSEEKLERLCAFLAEQVGIHFPRERWRDMERGIRSAAGELGFEGESSCIERLLSMPLNRPQIEVLACHLTVGETYFFRDPPAFEALEHEILPELIRRRRTTGRHLRMWSAGCASGEEAYSLAILLDRMGVSEMDWNVTLLATDINPQALMKARDGVYGDWSFRDPPAGLREKYFRSKGRRYELVPEMRRRVLFDYLNLARDVYPSLTNNTNAMDVIFCRNVLMYFSPQQARKAADKLYRSLAEGGWLIISPCEASVEVFSQFHTIHFPGVTAYRREPLRRGDHATWRLGAEPLPANPPPPLASGGRAEQFAPFPSAEEFQFEAAPEPTAAELPADNPRPSAFAQASTLYEKGECARAVEIVEKESDAPAKTSEAWALLARAHANQGQLVKALECCGNAIEADKLRAGYHFLKAAILTELGKPLEAECSLRRALYLETDFVLAHVVLGNLLRQQGKRRAAAKHLDAARLRLSSIPPGEILPESDGLTAGRLMEILKAQEGTPPGSRATGANSMRNAAGVEFARPLIRSHS